MLYVRFQFAVGDFKFKSNDQGSEPTFLFISPIAITTYFKTAYHVRVEVKKNIVFFNLFFIVP